VKGRGKRGSLNDFCAAAIVNGRRLNELHHLLEDGRLPCASPYLNISMAFCAAPHYPEWALAIPLYIFACNSASTKFNAASFQVQIFNFCIAKTTLYILLKFVQMMLNK